MNSCYYIYEVEPEGKTFFVYKLHADEGNGSLIVKIDSNGKSPFSLIYASKLLIPVMAATALQGMDWQKRFSL